MKSESYLLKGQRRRMVEDLRKKGIREEKILKAFSVVPRHKFMAMGFEEWAYRDQAFQIDCNQTISQPYTVAIQTSLLEIKQGDKLLEIGTGSGYQAAILAELGVEVYTIERFKQLMESASENLKATGYTEVKLFYGDGWKGLPEHAPFDKILVTASPEAVPKNLLLQLKPGGIAVVPVGPANEAQKMYKIYRNQDGTFTRTTHGLFRFVPMLKGKT